MAHDPAKPIPPQFTIRADAFGPIRDLDFEVKPLTVITGENNTGKSLLLQLVWAIALPRADLLLPGDLVRFTGISHAEQRTWPADAYVRLEFPSLQNVRDVYIHGGAGDIIEAPFKAGSFGTDADQDTRDEAIIASLQAMQWTYGNNFFSLASGRVGLSHALPALTKNALSKFYRPHNEDPFPSRLTSLSVRFLSDLIEPLVMPTGPAHDLADLLESEIGGRIVRRQVVEDWFVPVAGEPQPIPLTSTVASEIGLFARWLRTLTTTNGLLVIEEPEAHIHPALQRTFARVLVRLVRRGMTVVLATHSDIFVQQINNLIKLGSLDEARRAEARAQLPESGFVEEEWLKPEEVGAYEMQRTEPGLSKCHRLEVRPDGIVATGFNEELLAMLREAGTLEKLLDGEE